MKLRSKATFWPFLVYQQFCQNQRKVSLEENKLRSLQKSESSSNSSTWKFSSSAGRRIFGLVQRGRSPGDVFLSRSVGFTFVSSIWKYPLDQSSQTQMRPSLTSIPLFILKIKGRLSGKNIQEAFSYHAQSPWRTVRSNMRSAGAAVGKGRSCSVPSVWGLTSSVTHTDAQIQL